MYPVRYISTVIKIIVRCYHNLFNKTQPVSPARGPGATACRAARALTSLKNVKSATKRAHTRGQRTPGRTAIIAESAIAIHDTHRQATERQRQSRVDGGDSRCVCVDNG